ncbi:MAG TPA: beta-ketoacyl synthase N-terminal-like domain-containing protein, partial [Geobacteraceae bacterium]
MTHEGAYKRGREVYVVDGLRTPFLKARGVPGPFRAADLAVAAGRALLLRHPFEPEELDEVILGCVIPGPDEANIARVVALRLGCGKKVPAWTVQRNCGSGMQAIDAAAADIAHGRADLVLAGGTEAMSHAPVLFNTEAVELLGEWGRLRHLGGRLGLLRKLRRRHFRPVVALLHGLTDPVVGLSMGQTAEELAQRFGVSRERMDAYAMESHHRLGLAMDDGRLAEISPLYAPDG